MLTNLSLQLHTYGANKSYIHTNSEAYEEHRRNIQNNMSAARYLSPQLQNFAQFVVPLEANRPRRLAILPPSQDGQTEFNNTVDDQ